MRCGINYIDKYNFFTILLVICEEIYTIRNIIGGFSYTGILLFNPEAILSQLQIIVRTPTLETSRPGILLISNASLTTPHNIWTLQRQAESIK